MGNQELLFASLVGSKIVKTLPRFKLAENELRKIVLPHLPIIPFQNQNLVPGIYEERADNLWRADEPVGEDGQFFPLSFSVDGQSWFLMPYEPILNINGKIINVKRRVAKWNAEYSDQLIGSIKERWAQDDYDISITGFLMGAIMQGTVEDCFPKSDFQKLKTFLTTAKHIYVKCAPLELLGINKIVIDDFTFPFTKGENVQAYDIKACSDSSYNLLIEY